MIDDKHIQKYCMLVKYLLEFPGLHEKIGLNGISMLEQKTDQCAIKNWPTTENKMWRGVAPPPPKKKHY